MESTARMDGGMRCEWAPDGTRRVAGPIAKVHARRELATGQSFHDILEFKKLLLSDERQLARNLANQLAIYATGAPVRFSDREVVESILDQTQAEGYRTADLIHAIVQSPLFKEK